MGAIESVWFDGVPALRALGLCRGLSTTGRAVGGCADYLAGGAVLVGIAVVYLIADDEYYGANGKNCIKPSGFHRIGKRTGKIFNIFQKFFLYFLHLALSFPVSRSFTNGGQRRR